MHKLKLKLKLSHYLNHSKTKLRLENKKHQERKKIIVEVESSVLFWWVMRCSKHLQLDRFGSGWGQGMCCNHSGIKVLQLVFSIIWLTHGCEFRYSIDYLLCQFPARLNHIITM